jgi:hypothetical protein
MSGQSTKVVHQQKAAVALTLKSSPTTLRPGASTVLAWNSKDVGTCSAGGAWSGGLGPSGTRVIQVSGAGNHAFNLNCQKASAASIIVAQ